VDRQRDSRGGTRLRQGTAVPPTLNAQRRAQPSASIAFRPRRPNDLRLAPECRNSFGIVRIVQVALRVKRYLAISLGLSSRSPQPVGFGSIIRIRPLRTILQPVPERDARYRVACLAALRHHLSLEVFRVRAPYLPWGQFRAYHGVHLKKTDTIGDEPPAFKMGSPAAY